MRSKNASLFSIGIARDLEVLKEKSLYRALKNCQGLVDFSSNNYLSLTRHPYLIKKTIEALKKWGTGSGASRLLSGNLKIHELLEEKIAKFKSEESALIFSSGYLANLGVVTALVGEGDLVLSDRLNHASLIDAAKLSRAKLWVYPHRDTEALLKLLKRAGSFKKKLLLTDAYFSMDGDIAPLKRLHELCEKYDVTMLVDEAHSTGVFGKRGRGLTEHFALCGKIPIVMGTLSKALGSVGGFIAGSKILKEKLINRSKTFIYTTAPSPLASAAALAALELIEKEDCPRKQLWENAKKLREGLKALNFDLMDSEGPVIPLLLADTKKTLTFQDYLMKKGYFVTAIRPPTVPRHTDRIRLSVTAGHTDKEIKGLLFALGEAKNNIL